MNDGFDDLISAPSRFSIFLELGRAYVVFGRPTVDGIGNR